MKPGQGSWRTRNGQKAEIPWIVDGEWHGTVNGRPARWNTSGHCNSHTPGDVLDIVAEWTDSQPPAAPTLTIEPGEFQTRDGCKANVECQVANGWWRGTIGGAGQIYWRPDGSYTGHGEHALDIIARWPQPAAEQPALPTPIDVNEGDWVLCSGVVQTGGDSQRARIVFQPGHVAMIPRSAIHSIIERAPVDPQPGDVVTWGTGSVEHVVLGVHGAYVVTTDPRYPDQEPTNRTPRTMDRFRIVKRAGK